MRLEESIYMLLTENEIGGFELWWRMINDDIDENGGGVMSEKT